MRIIMTAAMTVLMALPLSASHRDGGCDLTISVDGVPRTEYVHRGATYVEALRGADYTLRLTNPHPYRVAVALSVDGLNTIDAKHTSAWRASKWVLDPYETTEISGWQVNDRTARRFYFTSEDDSYGAAIGKTANLGVIEAVFFREMPRRVIYDQPREYSSKDAASGHAAPRSAEAPSTQSRRESDDYAATGMGDRTRHEVQRVDLELDPTPIASVKIRYEFRPALIKLGVIHPRHHSPLDRREQARGFEGYCPEP